MSASFAVREEGRRTDCFGVLVRISVLELEVNLVGAHVHEGQGLVVLANADNELRRMCEISRSSVEPEERRTTVDPNLTDCGRSSSVVCSSRKPGRRAHKDR